MWNAYWTQKPFIYLKQCDLRTEWPQFAQGICICSELNRHASAQVLFGSIYQNGTVSSAYNIYGSARTGRSPFVEAHLQEAAQCSIQHISNVPVMSLMRKVELDFCTGFPRGCYNCSIQTSDTVEPSYNYLRCTNLLVIVTTFHCIYDSGLAYCNCEQI